MSTPPERPMVWDYVPAPDYENPDANVDLEQEAVLRPMTDDELAAIERDAPELAE